MSEAQQCQATGKREAKNKERKHNAFVFQKDKKDKNG